MRKLRLRERRELFKVSQVAVKSRYKPSVPDSRVYILKIMVIAATPFSSQASTIVLYVKDQQKAV